MATVVPTVQGPQRDDTMTPLHDPLRPIVFAYTVVRDALAAAAEGRCTRDPDGTVLAVSGAPVATLNGVISPNRDPNPQVLESLAGDPSLTGLPWSIQVRGRAGRAVTDVAARFGLTAVTTLPLMIRRPGAGMPPAPAGSLRIRPVEGEELGLYARTMAEGFGVPHEVFAMFAEPALAKTENFTFYLAEADGVPVGTVMSAVTDNLVGVFNISVLPQYRRQGHGQAITAEIIRAGQEAGATTAYLYSSPMGEPVYASLGFRTEEILTAFTAPA
ncbi:GNAT family N-acetyltransferase [Streptomyces sp. MI02-2A]|uniref:GNAT family N-acetyltransferase n=1 Tax=unclassified Streptomyces TaxID=2593676 RepID=UPI000E3B5239|nr:MULTISPECIES: GNAT family N-acetyltransferase [unclassified Streptomyces]MDX3262069.1 GNAT family N-acetyltransferase [Streptomyces sp. MI02-2A]REE65881.1 ribosomal protein S18 acetylase RimI-like enzyme [Streptomyces sp. 3212.3]